MERTAERQSLHESDGIDAVFTVINIREVGLRNKRFETDATALRRLLMVEGNICNGGGPLVESTVCASYR